MYYNTYLPTYTQYLEHVAGIALLSFVLER